MRSFVRWCLPGLLVLAGCEAIVPEAEQDSTASGPEVADTEETAASAETTPGPDFTGIPDWRRADPEDLLLIEVEDGTIVVELSDTFAPNHAARMRQAARDGFFDGLDFYRVIDGFVAQGGRGEEADSIEVPQYPALMGEFELPSETVTFTPMIDQDLYAARVGHVEGLPAGQSEDGAETWALHCPGTVALARNNGPHTGDVEFYIVIGHGPRYLDRMTSVFGRVIEGMEHVQALRRGDPAVNSGVIADPAERDAIVSVRVAADLPEAERPVYDIMRTDSRAFHDAKAARRVRTEAFFYETPPAVLEACRMPAPVRRVD